jgi:hypothetical protein
MAQKSTNSTNSTNSVNKQLNNVLNDLTKVSLALNPNSKLSHVAQIMVDQMQTMQPQEIMPSSLVAAAQQYSGDVSPAVMTSLANFLYNAYRGYNAMEQQKQLNKIVQSGLEQQQQESAEKDLEKQRQKYLQILDREANAAVSAVSRAIEPIVLPLTSRTVSGGSKEKNLDIVMQAIAEIKDAQRDAAIAITNATSILEMQEALKQFQADVAMYTNNANDKMNPKSETTDSKKDKKSKLPAPLPYTTEYEKFGYTKQIADALSYIYNNAYDVYEELHKAGLTKFTDPKVNKILAEIAKEEKMWKNPTTSNFKEFVKAKIKENTPNN